MTSLVMEYWKLATVWFPAKGERDQSKRFGRRNKEGEFLRICSGVRSSGAGRSQSTHLRGMVGGRPSDNDCLIMGGKR